MRTAGSASSSAPGAGTDAGSGDASGDTATAAESASGAGAESGRATPAASAPSAACRVRNNAPLTSLPFEPILKVHTAHTQALHCERSTPSIVQEGMQIGGRDVFWESHGEHWAERVFSQY